MRTVPEAGRCCVRLHCRWWEAGDGRWEVGAHPIIRTGGAGGDGIHFQSEMQNAWCSAHDFCQASAFIWLTARLVRALPRLPSPERLDMAHTYYVSILSRRFQPTPRLRLID